MKHDHPEAAVISQASSQVHVKAVEELIPHYCVWCNCCGANFLRLSVSNMNEQ